VGQNIAFCCLSAGYTRNEKLRWPVLGSGAFSVADCNATYLEAGAGFTAGAGLDAAVVVLVLPTGFLVECLVVFFTGFLVVTGAVDVTAGVAGLVVCAGGFWAANIVVEATAKAIVSKVFFMAFFLPGEPCCSLALQLYGASDGKITR
jgi:hypothetical protein